MAEMIWYIRGSNELGALHDQFIEGPFRLMFRGTSLVIRIEGVPASDLLCEQASTLARRYVENLGRLLADTLTLLTEEEYMALPIWAHQNHAMQGMRPREWAPDGVRVIREARNSVISYEWLSSAKTRSRTSFCQKVLVMQLAQYGSSTDRKPFARLISV